MSISKAEIEKITNDYYDDIYKFCVSKTRDSSIASDLTHECFLALIKKADMLKADNIRAWLYKAAAIEVKQYFRNRKKEDEIISFDELINIPSNDIITEAISEDEFLSLLTKTQKKILSVLTDSEKQLFIKMYMEKKTVDIVSNELGVTKNNLYVKTHRIKKKSKKIISTAQLIMLVIIIKF